ncbi:nucleotide-diphospho-sugar transferase [Microdochium bolleyi]|uniref:Nucleotide-diphospho-sugar transferase n=1 Tax=Microdochium bolleyi TaxID=196109 RepID=A0A136J3E4_9PEZI|nr:nucleotide-diphospho-sugar transferase [Microdochium bolleyi]
MAPFSAAWASLTGYSAVPKTEASGSDSASALNKPTITQILTSKQVRVAASVAAVLGVFYLAFHNYDRLPSLDDLRGGAASSTSECKPAVVPPYNEHSVDWSRFAYTQYVTNKAYLCNSVMIFETLHRLGSKADRVMMYPDSMMDPAETNPSTEEAKLLAKARDEYKVKLTPVGVQKRAGGDATWAESFTKLLAFNQTQYDRVVNVDSDGTILQTMDELFLMPPCPVAMPRAYWLFPDNKILSSQLMLVQPSAVEFDRIMKKMETAGRDDYDMEIVNQLYADSAMILPHRPYDLLTGEFRAKEEDHYKYLGTDREAWDPVAIFNEAKFLHFSDWPVPKPWIPSTSMREQNQPACVKSKTGGAEEDCTARTLWNGFYKDFEARRAEVCKVSGKKTKR